MILDWHPNCDKHLLRACPEIGKLRGFLGYWGGTVTNDQWTNPDENNGLPNPQSFVDESWDKAERAKVVAYLRSGRELIAWRGYSWCRFRCDERNIGSRCLTDGAYGWPEGFVHYVEKHGVKPPEEFIEHVRSFVSHAK